MKTKIILFSFLVTMLLPGVKMAKADEGMWLPLFIQRLNYTDMQAKGLKLTAEEIYSVNNSSLKDAIIQFGNGCTGEIISPNGLILTNHHCGYGNIQEHSSINHDYLTDGFWAMSHEEELPNPGLTAKFLIRVEDVSSEVLKGVTFKLSEKERAALIKENLSKVETEAKESNQGYDIVIKSFFGGNEYYMFVIQTFKDVRLVGAPPSAIGKFGGDTDNWMWPRHTGDFSMFRVYSAPDGSPADYSKENIPLKVKRFLPISIDGVEKGDFAMILGYPGTTQRYLTSYGVDYNVNTVLPLRIDIRRTKLDIMSEDMAADAKVRIQYASKYARISNYWKNFIGMTRGLKRLDVANQKRATELKLKDWISQFPTREEEYGTIFKDLESSYSDLSKYAVVRYSYFEAIMSGAETMYLAMAMDQLEKLMSEEKPDKEKMDKYVSLIKKRLDQFFKDFNLPTDKKLFAAMMKVFNEKVPVEQQPTFFVEQVKKFKGDFNKMADVYYSKSIFTSKEVFSKFLDNPSLKALKADKIYQITIAFMRNQDKYNQLSNDAQDKLDRANRLFIDALRKMEKDQKFYPDANSTMRLTYGNVLDYTPADGVLYKHFTTIDGIMQKEDPNNPEFVVPKKLKELYMAKDYGRYGEGNTLKTCFLTDNDITGGNSGSPVINGNGELIGLAFDGNWEAMSGDIAFEPELQRTISVDIRYVLFIIDKYAGAKNLIEEMEIRGKKVN